MSKKERIKLSTFAEFISQKITSSGPSWDLPNAEGKLSHNMINKIYPHSQFIDYAHFYCQ